MINLRKFGTYEFIKHNRLGNDYKIYFRYYPLFGKPKEYCAVGSITVFNYYPSGQRCGTKLEFWLSGVIKRIKWETQGYLNKNLTK